VTRKKIVQWDKMKQENLEDGRFVADGSEKGEQSSFVETGDDEGIQDCTKKTEGDL